MWWLTKEAFEIEEGQANTNTDTDCTGQERDHQQGLKSRKGHCQAAGTERSVQPENPCEEKPRPPPQAVRRKKAPGLRSVLKSQETSAWAEIKH